MSWPITKFVKTPYDNVEKIFPLKQAAVEAAVEACKLRGDIKALIVFGSSVTSACNPWSDVDIYVVGADRFHSPLHVQYDDVFDIWYSSDRLDAPADELFREIDNNGIVVYSRSA